MTAPLINSINQDCQKDWMSYGKSFVCKIFHKGLDIFKYLNPFNTSKQANHYLNDERKKGFFLSKGYLNPAFQKICSKQKNSDTVNRIYQNQKNSSFLCEDNRLLTRAYMAQDITGVYSSVNQLVSTILNQEVPNANQGLNFVSGLNLLTGYMLFSQGYAQYKSAQKTNLCWGKFLGQTKIARGVIVGLNGIVMLPCRTFSLVATQTGSKTAVRAAAILGKGGNILSAISGVLMVVPSAIGLKKQVSFYREFKNCLHMSDDFSKQERAKYRLDFLIKQLDLTDKEREKIANKTLSKSDHEALCDDVQEGDDISSSDTQFIEGFIQDKAGNKEEIQAKLKMAFRRERLRKKAELEFKIGEKGVKSIFKEVYNKIPGKALKERLLKETDRDQAIQEIDSLIDEVYSKGLIPLMMQNAWMCLLGATLVVLCIVSCFVTMGIPALVVGILWVALSLSMLSIDIKELIDAHNKGDSTFKDHLISTLINFMMITAIVLGVVFSAGTIPLITSGIVGSFYLILCLYSFFGIQEKETKRKSNLLLDKEIKPLDLLSFEKLNKKRQTLRFLHIN